MANEVFEMSELLMDQVFDLQEENKELTERLRVACETIEQLKYTNKELSKEVRLTREEAEFLRRVIIDWKKLWRPIDDLVRPVTPLGWDVSKKALEIIKDSLEGKS